MNKMNLQLGNCVELLSKIEAASVQLVYLDPPFFTQKFHSLKTRDNSAEYGFSDKWNSLPDYLFFLREVLVQCKNVLKKDGSLFFHCDKSASHHIRVLLDEVFGAENFQSEIIWAYKRWSNSKKGLLNSHQTIYFYSRTADFKFNMIYTDYSPTTNLDQILQARKRDDYGKSVYSLNENGQVKVGSEKKGVPLADVWNIPFLNPKAKERAGYPTQKPILLLERIIEISTDKADIVLDPFCGSGTTLLAADLLNREFIGMDISSVALELTKKRLANPIKTESEVLEIGEESYLKKSEYERSILNMLDAFPVERNAGIDGFLREYVGEKPVSIKIQKRHENLDSAKQKLITASQNKNCSFMILVKTQTENNALFPFADETENLLVIDSLDLLVSDWIKQIPSPSLKVSKCFDSVV